MFDVSFVIPVYGTEPYLRRCLDSVARQTYPHERIQIVVVDDCSLRGDAHEIVSNFSADNPGLDVAFVRHDRNLSLFQARRSGVLHARGAYVFSLDSDDEVDSELCSKLLPMARRENLDIVRCRMLELRPDGGQRPDVYTVMDCTSGERLRQSFLDKQIHWPMCGKLIRTSIYRKSFAALSDVLESSVYVNSMEDLLQFFPMALEASSYRSVDYFGYLYHLVPTSLSHGIAMSASRWQALCENVGTVRRAVVALAQKRGFTSEDVFRVENLFTDTAINVLRNEAIKYPKNERMARVGEWLSVFDFSVIFKPLLYAVGEGEGWRLIYEAGIFAERTREVGARSVAVVVGRYRMGGTERVISRLFAIWRQHLPELKLHLVTFEQPSPDDYPLPLDVRRVQIDPRADDALYRFVAYIRSEGIDTVVAANVSSWECNRFAVCARKCGARTIGMMHGSFAYFMTFAGRENWFRKYRLAAYNSVISVSELTASVFRSLGIEQCVFVRNPLPYVDTAVEAGGSRERIVLYVGRFSVEKCPETVIRVFAKVHRRVPDARLIMVGDSEPGQEWLRDRMLALRESLGLHEAIEFVGAQQDVRPYYAKAMVHVMTSRYEGAPVVLVEAKQCGVPSVIMDLSYLDGVGAENGCVQVPQGDEDEMADAIAGILEDPELRQQLAAAALKSVEGYSDDSCVKSWQAIFSADGAISVGATSWGDVKTVLESLNWLMAVYIDDRDALEAAERERVNARINALNVELQKKVAECEETTLLLSEALRVANSRSYKIGRMVTWPYRMVRNTGRCYRDNGFWYTLWRIPMKFVNLWRRFFG